MNSLEHIGAAINELKLNQGNYFQSLLQEAMEKGILSESRLDAIRYEILELVTKEVDRYNNGESSSIPVEKAQELLQSISYLIGAYLKTAADMNERLKHLNGETMTVLFWRGVEAIELLRKEAYNLLKQLQAEYRSYMSIAYHDTLFVGLEEAFHDYNTEFGANEAGGSIDYPLMIELQDYLGMEYLYQYLKQLSIEDSILQKFTLVRINRILHYYDPEAEQLLINLCELTIINALGCLLLHKDCRELSISRTELSELKYMLGEKKEDDIEQILRETVAALGEMLMFSKEELHYLMRSVPELKVRLYNNVKLDALEHFFTLTEGERRETEEIYGGISMEDEELRELIKYIGSLVTVEAKVSLIKEKVRSIIDLTDLLEECFYPEEYQKVYQLLGEDELLFLKKSILQEAGNIDIIDYEPNCEWQKQLLLYLERK